MEANQVFEMEWRDCVNGCGKPFRVSKVSPQKVCSEFCGHFKHKPKSGDKWRKYNDASFQEYRFEKRKAESRLLKVDLNEFNERLDKKQRLEDPTASIRGSRGRNNAGFVTKKDLQQNQSTANTVERSGETGPPIIKRTEEKDSEPSTEKALKPVLRGERPGLLEIEKSKTQPSDRITVKTRRDSVQKYTNEKTSTTPQEVSTELYLTANEATSQSANLVLDSARHLHGLMKSLGEVKDIVEEPHKVKLACECGKQIASLLRLSLEAAKFQHQLNPSGSKS